MRCVFVTFAQKCHSQRTSSLHWYNECTNVLVKNEFYTEEKVSSTGVIELLGLLDDREKFESVIYEFSTKIE